MIISISGSRWQWLIPLKSSAYQSGLSGQQLAWYTISQLSNPKPANEAIGLLYNLYADRFLGLNLVPQSIYDMRSAFYPTVAEEYGVPLDTRNAYTKCESSS